MRRKPSLVTIGPAQQTELTAHLQRLGEKGRFFRFHNSIQDEQIARYCQGMPWEESSVLGWLDEDGVLRGSCQIITAAGDRTLGEFGIAVERDYRRKGVATELLWRAFEEAQRLGIGRLLGHIHPQNKAMLSLAAQLGFRFNPEIEAHEVDLDRGAATDLPCLAA